MATTEQTRDRHAVPRLRSFASSRALGELASSEVLAVPQIPHAQLADLVLDWELEPGISVAADLVSSAVANGKSEVALEAARFLISTAATPEVARKMAGVCLGEIDPQEIAPGVQAVDAESFVTVDKLGAQIRRTRAQLIRYPSDAILWTNLATLYVALGQRRQARRAIRAALSLARENRFVLRSAGRILLHLEEREESHAILASAAGLKTDPWLLAAEISIAAATDTQSEHIKLAERLLEKEIFSPADISELASEVATIRALDGNTWAAKKLLRRAMKHPSENAWAQAVWLARIPGMPAFEAKRTISFEANAMLSRQDGRLRQSIVQTQQWQDDQPFSSRPAQMGSLIASRIDRDDAGIKFSEQGLRTNPDHPILLNNLAFSAARIGQMLKARSSLRRIDKSKLDESGRSVVTATEGLVAFREGDFNRGRSLYMKAIHAFRQKKSVLEAVAFVYQALEELRAGTPQAKRLQDEALKLAKDKLCQPEDRPLIRQLENFGKEVDRTDVALPKAAPM